MPPKLRPQTLKQAKRAYRKSGGTPHLSASELAQAERRAALQERADRIKEREARRKANLKKREEKVAREREKAKRTGRPFVEDNKTRWKIGPSQLSLGGFMGGLQKPSKNAQTEAKHEDITMKVQPEGAAVDQVKACTSPPNQSLAEAAVHEQEDFPLKERYFNSSTMQMPPPPIPQSKSLLLSDDAFDDCFPSNSQIERELSPPLPKPAPIPSAATTPPRPLSVAKTARNYVIEDADDFLASISTQDLDFSGGLTQPPQQQIEDQQDTDVLAQICTQDLDFEDEPSRPALKPALTDLNAVLPDFEDESFRHAQQPGTTDLDAVLAEICTQDLDFSDDVQAEMKTAHKEFDDGMMDDDLEGLAMAMELEEAFAAKRKSARGYVGGRIVCEVR